MAGPRAQVTGCPRGACGCLRSRPAQLAADRQPGPPTTPAAHLCQTRLLPPRTPRGAQCPGCATTLGVRGRGPSSDRLGRRDLSARRAGRPRRFRQPGALASSAPSEEVGEMGTLRPPPIRDARRGRSAFTKLIAVFTPVPGCPQK